MSGFQAVRDCFFNGHRVQLASEGAYRWVKTRIRNDNHVGMHSWGKNPIGDVAQWPYYIYVTRLADGSPIDAQGITYLDHLIMDANAAIPDEMESWFETLQVIIMPLLVEIYEPITIFMSTKACADSSLDGDVEASLYIFASEANDLVTQVKAMVGTCDDYHEQDVQRALWDIRLFCDKWQPLYLQMMDAVREVIEASDDTSDDSDDFSYLSSGQPVGDFSDLVSLVERTASRYDELGDWLDQYFDNENDTSVGEQEISEKEPDTLQEDSSDEQGKSVRQDYESWTTVIENAVHGLSSQIAALGETVSSTKSEISTHLQSVLGIVHTKIEELKIDEIRKVAEQLAGGETEAAAALLHEETSKLEAFRVEWKQREVDLLKTISDLHAQMECKDTEISELQFNIHQSAARRSTQSWSAHEIELVKALRQVVPGGLFWRHLKQRCPSSVKFGCLASSLSTNSPLCG